MDANRTDFGKYGYNGELKKLLTSGEGFIPIGSIEENNKVFYGIFDGNNYNNYVQNNIKLNESKNSLKKLPLVVLNNGPKFQE